MTGPVWRWIAKHSAALQAVGTISASLVAAVALGFAYWQISIGREVQREATAKQVWREYLSLAFSNDEFVDPKACMWRAAEPQKFKKYDYFVGHLLFAAEEVYQSQQGDAEWEDVIRQELALHREYLCNTEHWQSFVGKNLACSSGMYWTHARR